MKWNMIWFFDKTLNIRKQCIVLIKIKMVSHKNYARLVCMGESWPWSLAHTAFVFCFCFFAQSSYKELISKVLNTFKPGRFLMTLFANEVSSTCSQVKLLSHVCKWTVIQILKHWLFLWGHTGTKLMILVCPRIISEVQVVFFMFSFLLVHILCQHRGLLVVSLTRLSKRVLFLATSVMTFSCHRWRCTTWHMDTMKK